mgnify:FL=1
MVASSRSAQNPTIPFKHIDHFLTSHLNSLEVFDVVYITQSL